MRMTRVSRTAIIGISHRHTAGRQASSARLTAITVQNQHNWNEFCSPFDRCFCRVTETMWLPCVAKNTHTNFQTPWGNMTLPNAPSQPVTTGQMSKEEEKEAIGRRWLHWRSTGHLPSLVIKSHFCPLMDGLRLIRSSDYLNCTILVAKASSYFWCCWCHCCYQWMQLWGNIM